MIQTRSLLRKGGNLSSIARRSLSSEAEIEVDLGNVFTTHSTFVMYLRLFYITY